MGEKDMRESEWSPASRVGMGDGAQFEDLGDESKNVEPYLVESSMPGAPSATPPQGHIPEPPTLSPRLQSSLSPSTRLTPPDSY